MNILIFTHVCIDKNTSENVSYTAVGGPGVFMNKIFSQLSFCQTTVVSPYGKDFLIYKQDLLLYPAKPTEKKTLIYENITNSSGLRFQKAYNQEKIGLVRIDKGLRDKISQADIIIFAPILPNLRYSYLKKIKDLTAKKGLAFLFPQGYFRDFDSKNNVIVKDFIEAEKILSLVEIVVLSELDYPDIEKTAQNWVDNHNIIVIITLGEKGALIVSRKGKEVVETDPVPDNQIIDSVGSGDVFGAGLIYEYRKSKNIKKAVRFGHKLARQCLLSVPDKIKIEL